MATYYSFTGFTDSTSSSTNSVEFNWSTAASTNTTITFEIVTTNSNITTSGNYYWAQGDVVAVENDQTWYTWVSDVDAGGITLQTVQQTPEERERHQREIEERNRLAKEAKERAEATLRAYLSKKQREELDKYNYFTVYSRNGSKNVYRIYRGRSGNVVRKIAAGQGQALCVHPADHLPDADTMLAQALHIEHNEKDFLAKANKQGTRQWREAA